MPNWCDTQIIFDVEKEEDLPLLVDFHDKLTNFYFNDEKRKEFKNDPKNKNSSFSWIGNTQKIWNFISKTTYPRGFIQDIQDIDDKYFYLNQQDAWSEHIGIWMEIIKNFYDDKIKMYFIAEELGNCLFESNDYNGKYFIDKYVIDTYADFNNTFDLKQYDKLYETQGGVFHNFIKSIDDNTLNVYEQQPYYIKNSKFYLEESRPFCPANKVYFTIEMNDYYSDDSMLLTSMRKIKSYNDINEILEDNNMNVNKIKYVSEADILQCEF